MSTIGDFLASRTHERFALVGDHLGRLGAGIGLDIANVGA
jgi:hypothetical protein